MHVQHCQNDVMVDNPTLHVGQKFSTFEDFRSFSDNYQQQTKQIFCIANSSSSSRMRVINHNWSAMKQRLHLQSVAEISCHSVLSGARIRQCETSSGSHHKDIDQCL